ncbi:MAG: acyl-CoA dehydrogenase family protein [Blastocatellales bacterium]|nr:acyl-CoA dehydrogenase family protein [Blastocatellales bacterium]
MSTASAESAGVRADLTAAGRADLEAWERSQPLNYFDSDAHLQTLLEYYWGSPLYERRLPRLAKFGGEAATVADPAVRRANLPENLPRLDRFSTTGERTENVIHSPDHHIAGRCIYGSGAMSVYAEPGNNLLAMALFYLSSYNGEAGHNCPLACTAGIIKTLQQVGDAELREKYLPRLLDPDYDSLYHGAQFLTEIQGGSDVGANSCAAEVVDAARGVWRLNGEKWFCSNITADLALVTARPAGAANGTKGLGLFLLPRRLDDGRTNGVYIRRLKDKLGTRSMATAEVDFRDAIAYQVGALDRGFQHVMDYVVNTSRLYNAAGSAGAARRAYVIARSYARHRRAFGAPIAEFPLIQDALAGMRSEVMAMTSGSMHLAHMRDRIELGEADQSAAGVFRFAVNLGKYRASISGTDVIRRGIEVLGGNGAMENFSVLPRLLRDSIIFEAWEGAHNTLLAQSLRDARRYRLHEPFIAYIEALFADLRTEDWKVLGLAACRQMCEEMSDLDELDEAAASVFFRPAADRMIYLFDTAVLAGEAEWSEAQGRDIGACAVVEYLWRRRLGAPDADRIEHLSRIADISARM